MSRSLVTPPAAEPLTVDEAKDHLRVDANEEDALIESLIVAARQWTEGYLGRALLTQTWDQHFDCFPYIWPYELRLDLPPLQSVTSVSYVDSAGVTQTLATSVYDVDTASTPGRIRLAYNQSWPSIRYQRQAVTVRFVAGFQTTDSPPVDRVPEQIRQGMLLLLGHLYEHREGEGGTVPMAVDALLSPYRVLAL